MYFIPMIILFVVVFFGLIFFLRQLLVKNIRKATSDLEEMSRQHALKEAEIERRLKEAKEESQKILASSKKEAEELRSQTLKESYAMKDGILKEAHQKSEDLIVQTEKTCEILKREVEDRIQKGSMDLACQILYNSLPEKFVSHLHGLWMKELETDELDLGHLTPMTEVKDIQLLSAFPLTDQQKQVLHDKFVKKFGEQVQVNVKVDPQLVAGAVITIGNTIIDGSLRNKIKLQVERVAK